MIYHSQVQELEIVPVLFHGMLQSAVNAAKIETALLGKCKDTDC